MHKFGVSVQIPYDDFMCQCLCQYLSIYFFPFVFILIPVFVCFIFYSFVSHCISPDKVFVSVSQFIYQMSSFVALFTQDNSDNTTLFEAMYAYQIKAVFFGAKLVGVLYDNIEYVMKVSLRQFYRGYICCNGRSV